MPSFSPSRIVLMIGDDGIVVVPHKIAEEPFFVPADDKQAARQLLAFLSRYPDARLMLVADNLAQDYRSDELPHLNFFDRAKLAKRRLKQAFPAARLAKVLPFKKASSRILMIGVHETNPVILWAERLRARLPVIALLPVEGARIMARLMPEAVNGWAMMISRQKSGGFRQIVTYKNDLVFTRLTPLPTAGSEDDAEIIARDIKASLDYLARYGMNNPQELSVLLLMPQDMHQAPVFTNLSLKSIRSLSPAGAAQILALPLAMNADEPTADIFFASYIAAKFRPVLAFMLPEAKQTWLTQCIRQCGMRVSMASLLVAVCAATWSAGDLASTLYETRKAAVRLNEVTETLEKAKAGAAPLTGPMGHLRQALEKRHIFEQKDPLPWQGLNALAHGLDQDVRIVKLNWRNDKNTALESFTVSLCMTSEVDAGDRASTVAAFDRAAQNIAKAMPDYAVLVVKPPYPSLPQESVTASAATVTVDPVGEIVLQRKAP